MSSGTAALHLAYLVAGLQKGDEAITTPNTFVATSNMMLAVGAKPVFCDIRLDTYNIDEAKIEKLIIARTKAIVPVHFAGQPCEMEKIKKIAKKHKLAVVEDACHALGAKYRNKKIGSCQYSDMAIFSFHPVKSITTGEGGAILTNNKKYYEKLLSLRSHGIHKDEKGKNIRYVGYSLVYHNTEYTEAEVIKKYFEKDVVERAFKKMKGPLSLRPIRVWLRRHVVAHVKVCYLSMTILSLLEYKSSKIKISGIDALKKMQYIYKVKLRHSDTKKEWDKVVTMGKTQEDLLKILKCSV